MLPCGDTNGCKRLLNRDTPKGGRAMRHTKRSALCVWVAACCWAAWAGEPEAIAPRGLLPRIAVQPVGVPEVVGEQVRLGVVVRCCGRPVEGVRLAVYGDRTCREALWSGSADAEGLVCPLVPGKADGRIVYATIHKPGYSSPAHLRLRWDLERSDISAIQDVTEWESTARLGKWELADGGAHVYFDWAHRAFARELLMLLVAQRKAVRALLGQNLEPMGAIVVRDQADEARYITRNEGRTLRHGVFIHGVRSWPIVATSVKELNERRAELHEFNLVLPHELTENSLFEPPYIGIEHRGTRWFRDGLAELVECTVPAAAHPDLVAGHLGDRIAHLKQGLAAGETTVDLLAWKQDSAGNILARYAAALASMQRIVEAIGWDGLRRVLATARTRMTTTSDDLQRLLAEAGAKDQVEALKAVNLAEAIETLEAFKAKVSKP